MICPLRERLVTKALDVPEYNIHGTRGDFVPRLTNLIEVHEDGLSYDSSRPDLAPEAPGGPFSIH
jgi:hypothetical protein